MIMLPVEFYHKKKGLRSTITWRQFKISSLTSLGFIVTFTVIFFSANEVEDVSQISASSYYLLLSS